MSFVFFVVAALVVGLDQLTKHAIATQFLPDESRIVVPHVLWLTYVQNHRGAFGIVRRKFQPRRRLGLL